MKKLVISNTIEIDVDPKDFRAGISASIRLTLKH